MGPLVLISRHVLRNPCINARDPEDISVRWDARAIHEVPANVRRWRVERHTQKVPQLVVSALSSQKIALGMKFERPKGST